MPDISEVNSPLSLAHHIICRVQEQILPFHPTMDVGHRLPGVAELRTPDKLGAHLSLDALKEMVRFNREVIRENVQQTVSRLCSILSVELQLPDLATQLPPKVICSDLVDWKDEWSAGQEDGYYEISGSFFACITEYVFRTDGRIRNHIGPIIHIDQNSLRDPSDPGLRTCVEEVVHYLQWLHEAPPELLDKIQSWRLLYEKDELLRNAAAKWVKERDLQVGGPFEKTESGILLPEMPWLRQRPESLGGQVSRLGCDAEGLAYRIMSEAIAELMRLRLGVSSEITLFDWCLKWDEEGLSGWNADCVRRSSSLKSDSSSRSELDSAAACYSLFMEHSTEEFFDQLRGRWLTPDMKDMNALSQLANMGSTRFPYELGHFLGYALGQELHKSEIFEAQAGLQEASYRFFSPLICATDRLQSMKDLVTPK